MYRRILASSGALLVMILIVASRAEANVIQCFDSSNPSCVTIGLFSWSEGSLTDDVFTVVNLSDSSGLPSGGGDFEDTTLILDGSTPGTLLGSISAPGQIDSGGVDFFFGTNSARLEFTFFSAPFAVELNGFDEVTILAESAVPEPSTVLLLSAAAAVVRLRRRPPHRR